MNKHPSALGDISPGTSWLSFRSHQGEWVPNTRFTQKENREQAFLSGSRGISKPASGSLERLSSTSFLRGKCVPAVPGEGAG